MTTAVDEMIAEAQSGIDRAQLQLAQSVASLDSDGVGFWADTLKFWVKMMVDATEDVS